MKFFIWRFFGCLLCDKAINFSIFLLTVSSEILKPKQFLIYWLPIFSSSFLKDHRYSSNVSIRPRSAFGFYLLMVFVKSWRENGIGTSNNCSRICSPGRVIPYFGNLWCGWRISTSIFVWYFWIMNFWLSFIWLCAGHCLMELFEKRLPRPSSLQKKMTKRDSTVSLVVWQFQ